MCATTGLACWLATLHNLLINRDDSNIRATFAQRAMLVIRFFFSVDAVTLRQYDIDIVTRPDQARTPEPRQH